jgi:GNAT superfamily N-acetyltransferase
VPVHWDVLSEAQHLPQGRHRTGDRHLEFYETRDNFVRRRRPADTFAVVRIVDLEPDDALWGRVFPVLVELRPDLDFESFQEILTEGVPQGYRFTAALDDAGRCIGVAGWRIMAATGVRRRMYLDDLVAVSDVRGAGVGARMLEHLERRANDAGCTVLELDCAVFRHDAHRFYLREGYHIQAHHFRKNLQDPPP